MIRLAPLIPIVLWAAIYPARMLLSHHRFATNAYDLSIFDYALWNLPGGGYVPFMGKSLLSDHAVPTLFALLPIYSLSPGPQLLIVVQLTAVLAAAILLFVLIRRQVSPLLVGALLFALLFGRRTHSAAMSLMYLESLEPALILAMILAWESRRWVWFAVMGALALGCKEDVALYVACFSVLMWRRGDRAAAVATATVSIIWLVLALTIVVPASRRHDGLGTQNPLWEERFPPPASGAITRALSVRSLGELVQVAATTGFVALGAPEWLLVAMPGAIANTAAAPEKQQAGLTGHYFWPLLPWLFVAAAKGLQRLATYHRRAAIVFASALIIYITVDSPLWQGFRRGNEVSATEAARIQSVLSQIPGSVSVTATANLVPHLPHRADMRTFGINEPAAATEYLVLSGAGNSWPLSKADVAARIRCITGDKAFEQVGAGDPAIFRRVGAERPLPVCGSDRAALPPH